MEVLLFSLNATVPIVFCVALGAFLRARGQFTPSALENLSDLCFNVLLPANIFNNLLGVDFSVLVNPRLMVFVMLYVVIIVVLLMGAYTLCYKDRIWVAAATHLSYRSNYVILGGALVTNMFGEVGARTASMLLPVGIIPFNLFAVWLCSVYGSEVPVEKGKMLRTTLARIATNPIILALAAGGVAALIKLQLPSFVEEALQTLSNATSAVSLLLVGATITKADFSQDRTRVLVVSAVRIVILPLIMMPLSIMMGFRGPELAALFILVGAPCAVSSSIMARKYNVLPRFHAQVALVTTVASSFTTFAGIWLLRWRGYI